MCGIAGWFGSSGLPEAPAQTVAAMLARIRHRGPDGSGTALLERATLGHLRLAIIDPSGGIQPRWSRDGRSALVFNGEIYNYREIRERLSARGVQWQTQSDSEVLLELLLLDGPGALGQLRGMYAFAFWDGHRSYGVLARDPCGIKPLFVRREGSTLWFASEAKAFPKTATWSPQLDAAQLHLLLNLRYPAGGSGLLQGVTQLPPGHYLQWDARGERMQAIATTHAATGDIDVRALITDSVEAHLVADVPVATYLSGGIDSAIVTMAGALARPGLIETFTIDAGDDPMEARNAADTARVLGVPNHAAALAPIDQDALTWLLWHLEVPKVNALQSAAVAQLAAQRVKVCLSGLGGDELFVGYRAHRHLAWSQRASRLSGFLAKPAGASLQALMPGGATFSEPWRAAAMLACGKDMARSYALLRNVWDGSLQRARIYGPRMLDQQLPDATDWIRQRWPDRANAVEAMAEFEWSNKMVDDLLWQEDRTSMASGLESRVPFVDERTRLALAGLRAESARKPGSKHLLKQAFREQLPAHILRRPKSGFQIDIASHFDALFGATIRAWLSPDRVRRHALFNPAFVAQLLALPRTKAHRWHFFLLLLMAQAQRWVELFETGEASVPARPQFTQAAR